MATKNPPKKVWVVIRPGTGLGNAYTSEKRAREQQEDLNDFFPCSNPARLGEYHLAPSKPRGRRKK